VGRKLALMVLTFVAGTPLAAQQGNEGGGIAAARKLFQQTAATYVRFAEAMPEEHYGFKPTPEVRSYGQILGHVANENYLFCASALGEPDPNRADFEKTTSKAELITALKAAFGYCEKAYALPESRAGEQATLFGNTGSRVWVLMYNVLHDGEHYGNLVTYLRLKGLVPPTT